MKVSVAVTTYNQELFISEAVDSVLTQEVNFAYEIVIGEDCSTDNTRNIVVGYQEKHPDKIRLLLQEKNWGGKRNWIQVLKACQGEYIALLDGDDYWTSPHKLQKQVDFLDNHPECAIGFHDATMFYEDGSRGPVNCCRADLKEISTLVDLVAENFIPTCATMFRSGLFGEFPDWFHTAPVGDWPLHILNAQHGKIGYINEVMAAYRIHPGGVHSRRNPIENFRRQIHLYETINAHLNFEYEDVIRSSMFKQGIGWTTAYVEQLVEPKAIQANIRRLKKVLDECQIQPPLSEIEKAQILGRAYADLGFVNHELGNVPNARYCLARAIRHDPSWLRNRGVWSIGVEALLGDRLVGWLRRRVRAVC